MITMSHVSFFPDFLFRVLESSNPRIITLQESPKWQRLPETLLLDFLENKMVHAAFHVESLPKFV